jgi:F-type H+-transporting ATPase subunit delta
MSIMRGASRESFAAARAQLASLDDARALSRDLFGIVHVLDGSAGLRRALTDPARDEASKSELATSLLADKVAQEALSLVKVLVAGRWSSPGNLSDAIELLAVEAEAAAAEADGTLDAVEDQLFRFARLISSEAGLRQALSDRGIPAERKQELVASLLAGKAVTSTITLVSALIASPRGRSIERGLQEFAEVAAARRGRSIAHVTTAVALSDAQRTRLAGALAEQAGRPIQLNVEVDPSIVGGMSVRLGDEILDGTIINRLADARRRLAG